MTLYQLRNYQRFSDQSAKNCQRKVHFSLCKVFVLLYFWGITVCIFLIYIAKVQKDFKLHQQLLLNFLSCDCLSAYIYQYYICNVCDSSDDNRDCRMQNKIQFVKVCTTQQFVSESLKYNIIRNLKRKFYSSKREPSEIH